MMNPKLLIGKRYRDSRGSRSYNNSFDTSLIKGIYFIENTDIKIIRAWQGHKIEQRCFNVVKGSFKIKEEFIKTSKTLDMLYVPKGFVSSIQALEVESKLLVMSDYLIGELNEEFHYDLDYFNN